jgi:hypothetical protein
MNYNPELVDLAQRRKRERVRTMRRTQIDEPCTLTRTFRRSREHEPEAGPMTTKSITSGGSGTYISHALEIVTYTATCSS